MPGPNGLPGGYPVRLAAGELDLDLPAALTRDEAIAWNLRYEQESGLVVGADGRATYTGRSARAARGVQPGRSLADFTSATSMTSLAR